MKGEDLSLPEALLQISGFSPSRLNERYDANTAIKGYEQAVLKKRERILNAYATALRVNDQGAVADLNRRLVAWNRAHPELAIDRATLRRSMTQRARYTARAESGIVVDQRIAQRAKEQGRFAFAGAQ